MAGCSTNRSPRYNWSTGEAQQFRRYTGRPAVDYFHRWGHQAFRKVEEMKDTQLTEDVEDVLKRHGQPDYERRNVEAQGNETFTEWVYWERNVLCQFIQGELVFEGPLTDSDRILVTFGYPDKAFFQQYETGPVREFWIYQKLMGTDAREYSFSDGRMVFQSW